MCDGLTSSHMLLAGDGITGLLANTVSLGHFPLSVFFARLRQCVIPVASPGPQDLPGDGVLLATGALSEALP